jgi:cellulose synthase/poly-beta-1,6-N-acetylglucosamine synthase-like glycosyltransferase
MNLEVFFSDTTQLYLYYALLCVFVVQLVYFLGIFSNFSFSRKKKIAERGRQQSVSVVICARNEYYSLERNLPHILEQDYPDFEVVLVNDDSDDDTKDLLNDFSRRYQHLTVINVQKSNNFFKGKKFPLALGIKSAKNDLILLTDADCKPVDKNWIRSMQQQFSNPNVKIVLGYGGYQVTKGFLNKLIQFDTLMIALQYFSFAKTGIPYMGVGRNLAYRKSLFIEKKGFVNH